MCADFDEIWIQDSQFDVLECNSGFDQLGYNEGTMKSVKDNVPPEIFIDFYQMHHNKRKLYTLCHFAIMQVSQIVPQQGLSQRCHGNW